MCFLQNHQPRVLIVNFPVASLWDMAQNQSVVAWEKAGPLAIALASSHENAASVLRAQCGGGTHLKAYNNGCKAHQLRSFGFNAVEMQFRKTAGWRSGSLARNLSKQTSNVNV